MIRSLVLFTHVVGVIALFAALILEWLGLDAIRHSVTRAEGMAWVRLSVAVPRVLAIALGATVLSGFYLGSRLGMLGSSWMLPSYGALLLIGLSGGLMARPLVRTLRLAVRDPSDRTFRAVQASASGWLARVSVRIRAALALAIVYLMIGKPDVGIALIVIGIALVSALVASLPKRQAGSAVMHGSR
jgi:hypothetical protein